MSLFKTAGVVQCVRGGGGVVEGGLSVYVLCNVMYICEVCFSPGSAIKG